MLIKVIKNENLNFRWVEIPKCKNNLGGEFPNLWQFWDGNSNLKSKFPTPICSPRDNAILIVHVTKWHFHYEWSTKGECAIMYRKCVTDLGNRGSQLKINNM